MQQMSRTASCTPRARWRLYHVCLKEEFLSRTLAETNVGQFSLTHYHTPKGRCSFLPFAVIKMYKMKLTKIKIPTRFSRRVSVYVIKAECVTKYCNSIKTNILIKIKFKPLKNLIEYLYNHLKIRTIWTFIKLGVKFPSWTACFSRKQGAGVLGLPRGRWQCW